jgi:hypothetical protein
MEETKTKTKTSLFKHCCYCGHYNSSKIENHKDHKKGKEYHRLMSTGIFESKYNEIRDDFFNEYFLYPSIMEFMNAYKYIIPFGTLTNWIREGKIRQWLNEAGNYDLPIFDEPEEAMKVNNLYKYKKFQTKRK